MEGTKPWKKGKLLSKELATCDEKAIKLFKLLPKEFHPVL